MNKIKKILLGSAFLVAIFIDLGLNIVSMATIAPAGLYVVAFIGIAFLTVLFAVQAWIKRNYILWLVLAFITLFFDVSFILASTELKSESITIIVTASSDPELKRIETAINEATDDKIRLDEQFEQSSRESTVNAILEAMESNRVRLDQLNQQYNDRLSRIESGELTETTREQTQELSARVVFYALPLAAEKGRWLEIIIWLLIFGSLQFIIVRSAGDQEEKKIILDANGKTLAVEQTLTRALVIDFIEKTFHYDRIPSINQMKIQEKLYKQIIEFLYKLNLVSVQGNIVKPNSTKEDAINIVKRIKKNEAQV
jgi:hypothetical protein